MPPALVSFLAGRPPQANPREPRDPRRLGRALAERGLRARFDRAVSISGPGTVREFWEVAEARGLLPAAWSSELPPLFCDAEPAPARDAEGKPVDGSLLPVTADDVPPDWPTAHLVLEAHGSVDRAVGLGEDFLARLDAVVPLGGPYRVALCVFAAGDEGGPDALAGSVGRFEREHLRDPWAPLGDAMVEMLDRSFDGDVDAMAEWGDAERSELGDVEHRPADFALVNTYAFIFSWERLRRHRSLALPSHRPDVYVPGAWSGGRAGPGHTVAGRPYGFQPGAVGRPFRDLVDLTAPLRAMLLAGWAPVTRQDPDPATGAPGLLVLGTVDA